MEYYYTVAKEMTVGFFNFFKVYSLTLESIKDEGQDIKTFVFKPNKPVKYDAGQYGLWFLKQLVIGKPNRLFSIASAPHEGTVQLSTRIRKSDFKQKLNKLLLGDSVLMFGPVGLFTLPKKLPVKTVFVAGGIGVTPMRAMAKEIYDKKLATELTFIHSGDNFYLYEDEMTKYASKSYFVTRDGFVSQLEKTIEDVGKDASFYLAGPPPFVKSAKSVLTKHGVKDIKQDGFLGY